jgi:uncharacterized protein (DUF1684 family)
VAGGLIRLTAALALSACVTASPGVTATRDATADQAAIAGSREFQRNYDQELRDDPASFLTTVAAYYLGPGDSLELARSEVGWIEASAEAPGELGVQAAVESLSIRHGSEVHTFEGNAQLGIDDRFTLTTSRQELDWRVLIHDREAPRRAEFPGVAWFPVDARFIVAARYSPRPSREPMVLQTSRGVAKTLYVAGEAAFELERGEPTASLLVFAYEQTPAPGEPMLIPFRDATSGKQSYAAGRYLELEAPTGERVILDFNRATNPLCAYSEHYNCPMPPRFNTLEIAVEAGAQA